MFWFKTVVACIGRLGITMAFEMVVFVNTELYPTFVRWDQQTFKFRLFVHFFPPETYETIFLLLTNKPGELNHVKEAPLFQKQAGTILKCVAHLG